MRGSFQFSFPQKGRRIFPEASTLRSPRDPDVVAREHIKHEDVSYDVTSLRRSLLVLWGIVTRLRMRSSQGGTGSGALNFVGEYDPTRTYSAGQIVIVSMGSNAGTYCYINPNPSSGKSPWLGGGFWVQLPGSQLGVWM